jgi:nitrogen fixation NifU-like protein
MSNAPTQQDDRVLAHFLNPCNVGDLADADGVGEVGAVTCGDVIRISIKVRDGRIAEARFRTFGCGSAIACASMATELIKGRTIEEILRFSKEEVATALGGLPPAKIHCPVLAEEAVKAAVEDYLQKKPTLAPTDSPDRSRAASN